MKIPISKRLLACARFVQPGAKVADIGCDHGYLGIYLLTEGIASYVVSSDLREQPLQKARENAVRFGTQEQMEFHVADGLAAVQPEKADTVVCAGMGADSIIEILAAAEWIRNSEVRLILQPQSSGQALRGWLADQGFVMTRETLLEENGYLYTVLEAVWCGEKQNVSPGHQFVSRFLLEESSPLLPNYFARLSAGMKRAVLGLQKGADDPEKLWYYETALREMDEMRVQYGICE